ncbi:response regulator [Flexivirga caeni]|uniref:DNA-binding response regulator n=1 Tax=Flexivirga caeni TaxID=2294115 RepID=A0A3M9MBI5_9MICO|nr:response regulator transcription factor [Flexivirga caeni]RNI22929.1 DNA-binding response regulator [Flexivirga caeni]
MIRVLIVDDESLVRSGVSMILEAAEDIEVVGSCDGPRAMETFLLHRPDVVLLDIRMPEVDGLTVLQQLRSRRDPPRVAMLTTFSADEHVVFALRAGAAGFLLKDSDPEVLVQAVRALAAGGSVLSPQVTGTVINGFLGAQISPELHRAVAGLSPREREIMGLLGEGMSNAEIAEHLFLSVATVKEYVSAVLLKLGVGNRVQVAVLAYQVGLVHGS